MNKQSPPPRPAEASELSGSRDTVAIEIPAVRFEIDAEVLRRAEEVLGSRRLAVDWLQHKWPALDYNTPLELAVTPEGREAVMTLLGQIEYGVYV